MVRFRRTLPPIRDIDKWVARASSATTPSAFVQSIVPQESVKELLEARVLFDFMATSEFELEVRGGAFYVVCYIALTPGGNVVR
jgi:hypothetical protein